MIIITSPDGESFKEISTVGFRPEMQSRGFNEPWTESREMKEIRDENGR